MTRARRHVAVTALVAAALLAACGSSGTDVSSGSGSTTGSSNRGGIYGNPSDTSAPAAAGGATTAAAPAAGAGAVTIKGFSFAPGDLSVKVGTKVTWTNEDSAKHKIKSDDGTFDSDALGQGDTFEHTFDTAGTFAYICSIHPSMKGTITVGS